MLKHMKLFFAFLLLSTFLIICCNKKPAVTHTTETLSKGKISIVTDETLMPIVEDQVAVFENGSEAKIDLIPKSEAEAVNLLVKGAVKVAILSRKLSADELKVFQNRKINPVVTPFAVDALTFIRNQNNKDTLISLSDVIDFMHGKTVKSIKGLVFDNPNSSTARYLNELAGLKSNPEKGVFSFKNNEEVIKYVAGNDGMIGIVGLNWLTQPSAEMRSYTDKINVLNVKGLQGSDYYGPTQNNIAEKKYPLARDLFIVNCQGYTGLGTGFASFVAGDRGQRIILKSGLLPVTIPGRKIVIRK